MFTQPVALNRDVHRSLLFQPKGAYEFAAALNSMPLCASEFFAAAKEYAIVFVRPPDGDPFPVVVLGLEPEQNGFIGTAGDWQARYVPFAARCYPFGVTATSDPANLQVLIDAAYPGFGTTEGTVLFSESGAASPDLEAKLTFLRAHGQEIERTRRFGAELARLGLLCERSARLQADGQAPFHLKGFWVVDEDKLKALDDAQIVASTRSGLMALVTAHLLSISNLALLVPRIPSAAAEATPVAARSKSKKKA